LGEEQFMAKSKKLPPIHPGAILREDLMKPLGISMNRLALDFASPRDTHNRDCA
jgi:plasmid maintenance system antidote protein VapI